MKQLSKITLIALGFGLLAVALSSIPNHQTAAAGSAPVTVVAPLPLPVSGSVTGNVNATIVGTANVNATIVGTPAVSVSNTSSTPVFVDANGPARSPAGGFCTAAVNSSGLAVCFPSINSATGTTVPSGKTLVVDTVSVTISLGTGSKVQMATFGGFFSIGGDAVQSDAIFVPLTLTATNLNSLDEYTFASPVTIYSIAGQGLGCSATTNDTSQTGTMQCLFTGHFVSAS
jgi:hypothetical protein